MTIDLWTLERRLWIEGTDAFAELMDIEAVMVFPEPIGILFDGDILSEMDVAARWDEIEMSRKVDRRRDALVILNYVAQARRGDGTSYRAMCTSVWQQMDVGYRIVSHHQTPTKAEIEHPDIDRPKSKRRVSDDDDMESAGSGRASSGG
ncbi:hypothetical protein [Jannaschia donghaensis]|uniref:DUF4440 domain-containing protein n=1 Tax=Jannaschia donghaensis TaxID=420998 RepID=A0A0M6YPE9_9RHOB|nr:hypothetical protein [Jannaschia donghaensis]CTQ51127.1 hypothetical protein JDO7802_03165 [Jannaschia donghaensis]